MEDPQRLNSPSDPNPQAASPQWPPAVIGGAFRTGVLGMRSLARRGVSVACFDCDQTMEGFRSKYGRAFACPNPDVEPEAWVESMIRLSAAMGGRPVLICSADQFVSAVADHVQELAPHFVLSPGASIQGLLATKQTQYELAARHGMPMPLTKFCGHEEDVRTFAEEARFPCLIKPVHFREWQALPPDHPLYHKKVSIARSVRQLVDTWRIASVANPDVILQEIIEGPDTGKRVYLSCYDADGGRIAHAMFRELRCLPVGFGPATVSEPVLDAETDAICNDFLGRIGYSGICEIEMKRDARDGRVRMIEANPRLSGGGDAAPHAGVDLCWLHYLDLVGQEVTPVAPDGRDFRHVALRADLSAIIANRQAGMISWRDVLRSYRPPLAFFDLDPADWRYSLQTLYRSIRSGVGALLRAFRRSAVGPLTRALAPRVARNGVLPSA